MIRQMKDFDWNSADIKVEYREPETVRLEDVDSILTDFEKSVEQACIKLFKESFPRAFNDELVVNALDIWECLGDGFPSSEVVADIENAMKKMEKISVREEYGNKDSEDYYCSMGRLLSFGVYETSCEDKVMTREWALMPPYRWQSPGERREEGKKKIAELEENE